MSNFDKREKVLEVKNLKKYFYSGVGKNRLVIPAVDGISFDLYKREVLGLVGESGCGKTTTGRTIIKIYNPTDGSVKFNNVEISAGYETNLQNIREIKRKLKDDIKALKPNGPKILEKEAKIARKKLELTYELASLEERYKENQRKVRQPIVDYKSQKYEVKNNYTLTVESIEFDINERRKAIIDLTINKSKELYERELRMAKLSYERSSDGLKSSAALEKTEIKRNLIRLKEEHEATLIELETKYEPLIAEDEKVRKHKKEVKDQLKVLKQELKEKRKEEKEKYKDAKKEISRPNYIVIFKEQLKVRDDYLFERKDLNDQFKEYRKVTNQKIADLTEERSLTEEEKQKIAELKRKAKDDIRAEKAKIAEAKQINKSEESDDEITKMQMIFQDPISSLNPRMTVREIVSEGLVIQGGYTKSEIEDRVIKALDLVGLAPEFLARYPHEFSGGQRQRIGVARALVMNPDLIIADEPVSALDVSIRAQVINLLRELKDDLGLTILFIAHDLSIVEFFCDRIAVMFYGKIVELATSEDLFRNPMHPYTKSLLSAVPQPDPDYEKGRKRIFYDPRMHDYRFDRPTFRKIGEDHYVLANDKEFEQMQKEYKEK